MWTDVKTQVLCIAFHGSFWTWFYVVAENKLNRTMIFFHSMNISRCVLFIQVNALKAICPATLDVLLKILSSPPTGGGVGAGGDDVRQNKTLLHDLVLKCMVRTVHVVHCCSPDQVWCVCACVRECVYECERNIFRCFSFQSSASPLSYQCSWP